MPKWSIFVLVFGAMASAERSYATVTSFMLLPGPSANVGADIRGISGDGHVVVGGASDGSSAMRWVDGVPQVIWTPSGGTIYRALAYGSNTDGSVIAGTRDANGARYSEVWRSGQATDITGLPMSTRVRAVSGDGSVLVGGSGYGGTAFRYTTAGGAVILPSSGEAYGISADGQTIAGSGPDFSNTAYAAVWHNGVQTHLPGPAGYSYRCLGLDISPDGSTVVGSASNDQFSICRAAVWSNGTVMNIGALAIPSGAQTAIALGVSANGVVVVGQSGRFDVISAGTIFDSRAFMWTSQLGMVDLNSYCTSVLGLDLAGWNLVTATGTSDDGTVIVGNAARPNDPYNPKGFVITVPTPSAAGVLGLGLCVVGRRRRR